jgi:uncharacterized phage protein (TIGR01671 family)
MTENVSLDSDGWGVDGDGAWPMCECELQGIYIMQYTGLKDRRDREIFEGDIIRYKDTKTPIPEEDWKPRVVRWNEEQAAWFVGEWLLGNLMAYSNYTVIGKRYENPERIEGEK